MAEPYPIPDGQVAAVVAPVAQTELVLTAEEMSTDTTEAPEGVALMVAMSVDQP